MENQTSMIEYKLHQFTKSTFKTRAEKLRQQPKVFLFTGLPSSGKSTLADYLGYILSNLGFTTYILDGDFVRNGLNRDLTFSDSDIDENIRRVSHVSDILTDAGLVTLACFVSPKKRHREQFKKVLGDKFYEIYINTSIEECKKRDVRGLYKMAEEGKAPNMVDIDKYYEAPENPDLIIDTVNFSIDENLNQLENFVLPKITFFGS